MSFLYRPTPVVRLGAGDFSSRSTLNRLPGTTMQGIPAGAGALGKAGPTGTVSRMRRVNTMAQPWIHASGTMHGFTPNGLGDLVDDGTDIGIDWTTYGDSYPVLPDASTPDFSSIPAPDLGLPAYNPTLPVLIAPSSGPLPPIAGAGPTGTGIPGTQPVNTTTVAMQQAGGLLSAITNFFKPSVPAAPAGYKSLPGYGTAVAAPGARSTYVAGSGASWFTQSTIIPSIPNWGVVAIGVIAVVALSGGGYAAGARR